ncbi:MAG: lipopolysaccharide heptosyltransferase II [Deltaproteobacteria bacterium]|nr:lipopolysaccharide heptosyltransferase II [Deltaproteobacteria bacterium]
MPALAERFTNTPPRRILVVQTAWLGDTVFTSALFAGLVARFPGVPIDVCVSKRGVDVARSFPGVGEVLLFDKKGKDKGAAGLFRTARTLRERGYDLCVLPHRSLRSALLALRAKIPVRLGLSSSAARLLYTHTAPDPGGPFVEREAALLDALGGTHHPMRLEPTPEFRAAADALLTRAGYTHKRFAALCLGSEWETKIWPKNRVARLTELFEQRGLPCVLLGGPKEKEQAASIVDESRACLLDTCGNPIGEALAILARASVVVGGDTGLVHAARALGIPTVAVFGPTDPARHLWAPRQKAISLRLACAPCGEHGAHRCPLGHHKCLRDLDAERVDEVCGQFLDTGHEGPRA